MDIGNRTETQEGVIEWKNMLEKGKIDTRGNKKVLEKLTKNCSL